MDNLEREIHQLESDITHENASIKYQRSLLKERFDFSKCVPFLAIGGFFLGYFLGSKKIVSKFIFAITTTSLIAKRIYKGIKLLLLITY